MRENIIKYLKNDRIHVENLTRWQFYQIITTAIAATAPFETLAAIAKPITTTTTRSTTTTTSPTTTTKVYGRRAPPTKAALQHTRTRPLAPLAAIGIGMHTAAAANFFSSSVTGEVPFSWGGKTIVTLFGLKTSGQEDLRQLQGVGQAMENLKVNQIKIVSTVNVMNQKIAAIVTAVGCTFKATATMVIEQDLKMYIQHLLLVQQNAIQKYAHFMLAASVHQTSAFALS